MVSALLYVSTFVKHHDIIRVLYGTQSVRHYHNCLILVIFCQIIHYNQLISGVLRIGRFIKKKVIRFFVNRAGYYQPLLLSLTVPFSFHPDFGVVALRQ